MAVSVNVRVNVSYPVVLFAETSTGYFGTRVESTTSTRVTSNDSPLRIVAIPTTSGKRVSSWSYAPSSATITDHGLLSIPNSVSNTALYAHTSTSTGGPNITIIDSHGTHYGSPSGTNLKFYPYAVVAVQHNTTESGYVFKGWKVTFYNNNSNRGSILSAGGSTSGLETTFDENYTSAIVVHTGNNLYGDCTIESLYEQEIQPTIFTIVFERNNAAVIGNSIPSVTCSSTSYITLPNPSLWSLSNYTFYGWNTNFDGTGTMYHSGDFFTPTVSTYPTDFPDTVFLYAIWSPVKGSGAKQEYQYYQNGTSTQRISLWYLIDLSSDALTEISVNCESILQGEGAYVNNGIRYQTVKYKYTNGVRGNPTYSNPLSRSSLVELSFRILPDDPTMISVLGTTIKYPGSGELSYISYTYEDIPTGPNRTETYTSRNNTIGQAWKWIAPDIQNMEFVGWYTCSSSSSSNIAPSKTDFTILVSSDKIITWETLSSALNSITTANTETATYIYKAYTNYIRLKYRGVSVIVLFDANGGILTNNFYKYVRYSETYGTLPTPTWSGYTFVGWFTDPVAGTLIQSSSVVNVASTQYLYAHWSGGSITVTFDAMGGTSSMASKTVTNGEPYGQLPTVIPLSGFTFLGWFTLPVGGDGITANTTVQASTNHTLYAHYSVPLYTITFNGNGENSIPLIQSLTYVGGIKYGRLPQVSRIGFDFKGWFTESNGGMQITSDSIVTDEITLYAQWDIKGGIPFYVVEFN